MSSRRMHVPGDIHLVTNRCFQGRLFMLPSAKINFIIGYWFARALEKYGQGLKVFAFVFPGNHFHALVKDTQGTLARFMCYFHRDAAHRRKLCRPNAPALSDPQPEGLAKGIVAASFRTR